MKPESWQQFDVLFHSALERKPEERAAFLDDACVGDEALRKQVAGLLAANEAAGSFIESPAIEVEARELAADKSTSEAELTTGESFSHYRIISPLGSGGMGDVYLAQDTVLGRQVALKLLPEDLTSDQNRLRRFQLEARAASALNHPNIITIYEIGKVDDRHFIATEFIDGTTLRQSFSGEGQHTSGKQLRLREVLDIAIQTADALAAAHEAGIVHRDIKPENIMVRRRDGYVKVLDFGLAKLTEGAIDTEAPTMAQVKTDAGVVMGTVTYMSPEQARGEEVDVRTDIWSLGVVLYELVAGCSPFERSTPSEVIALILEREPLPLARYARELPTEMDRIVTKALTKDREERYQRAKDLLIDLRRLRQRLEVEAEVERTTEPREKSSEARAVATDSEKMTAITARGATLETKDSSAAPLTSLVKWIKLHRRAALISLAVLTLTLGALAYVWRGKQQTQLSFQTAKFARLTGTGKTLSAAISPDGKWLVHVQDDGAQKSLWLRQVAVANSNTQIVPPADVFYVGLAFSPDGNYIYYSAREKAGWAASLYQTPVLGGTTRKLTTGVESPVAFSPDGKQIAYFAFHQGGDEDDKLMVANADGTGARELAVRRLNRDEYFYNGPFNGVSWSPDGKTIVTPVGFHVENYMSVAAVSVASGEVKLITPRRWGQVRQVAWLGDGSDMLVTAQDQGTDTFNIWQLSYPTGEAQKLTNDLNSYPFISLTADARLLAAMQTERASNIWVLHAFDSAQAKPITQGRNYVGGSLSWTPEGRIVYSSNASGNYDLYAIDARGGGPKQLTTSPGADGMPFVSPDGRYVVFASDRAGRMNIWRMDIDGANAKQLTDKREGNPTLSPDGRWVVYSLFTNTYILWKIALDGSQPQQFTEKTSTHASFSPDGKQIACVYQQEASAPLKLAILSFADGKIFKIFDASAGRIRGLRWTVDGRALVYPVTLGGVSNLWAQPVDGGPPKQLTNFTAEYIFGFDISRDGKQVALSRGTQATDVVLISDFK